MTLKINSRKLPSFHTMACTAGLVLGLAMAGCGGPEQAAKLTPATVTPKVKKEKTETVAVSAVTAEVSPATQPTKILDADASPEQVCELFMKHLNAGERVKAERLLTAVALSTTAKAGLYLQPIGGQNAKVVINPAVYATGKKKLAQVDCQVSDIENGKTVTDDLTWVIRKSNSGWRILGFMLKDESGNNDFLSFENLRDVDAILQMSSASSTAPTTRAARLSSAESTR